MAPGQFTQIAGTPEGIRQAAGTLDAFCQAQALPDSVSWRLRVAVDEIVANIVAHAGGPAPPTIDLELSREGNIVEITVADDGPAFDPLVHPPPDVSVPLEAREPGGLGILILRSLIDEVRYTRTRRNELTLRTRIVAGPPSPSVTSPS